MQPSYCPINGPGVELEQSFPKGMTESQGRDTGRYRSTIRGKGQAEKIVEQRTIQEQVAFEVDGLEVTADV
jgi:hypothetical protein